MGLFQIKFTILFIFISYLFFYSCSENPGEFTLGEEFIESQTDLSLIDTFSVKLSTVLLDTVETSGTGNLLIGYYQDDSFGKITSNSYFQIGIPDCLNVKNDDTYDSLNLVIRYNKYSFGDTTTSQCISVHQLTENIEYDYNDVITSNTSFSYNPDQIGSIIYTPKPNNSIDTLAIKISDQIGLDLFAKLRDNSEVLADTESFRNYFHGMVLIADDAYEGSIIGFKANENDLKLILYTSRGTFNSEKINYEFCLNSPSKQFNNIKHDFTSTQLENLLEQRNELASDETGGFAFLQGGIGLAIRVDFPSLQEILLYKRGKIAEAQLSVVPSPNSYIDSDLPSALNIYESDRLNRRHGLVLNNQGSTASSTLILDELYHEETAYLFDVAKYLNDELDDSYVDPGNGLLITLPSGDLKSSFYRLILDAHNHNTKLKIYYLTY